MHDSQVTVRYGEESGHAARGTRLLDVLLLLNPDHRHICGGRGFCTSCRVEVLEGSENLSPVSAVERERLGGETGKLRLACQTTVYGPVHVRVPTPRTSRFSPFAPE